MKPNLKTLAALTVAAMAGGGSASASPATAILSHNYFPAPRITIGTDASARIHPGQGWSRRKRLAKIRAAYGGFVPRQYR